MSRPGVVLRRVALLCGAGLTLAATATWPAPLGRSVPGREPGYPLMKYADSLVSLNDRCMVKRSSLNSHIRPVYVSGEPLGFCCTACPTVFVKDPEPFITQQALTIHDAVTPRRKAVVSPATRARLNYELFYFADRASLERFGRDPVRYCGMLTNPANQSRFRPTPKSPRWEYAGRVYYFPDSASLRKFQTIPDSLAERTGA